MGRKAPMEDDQLVSGLPGDERSHLTRLRPGYLQRAFNTFKLLGSESPDSSWEDNPSTPSRVLGLSSSMMRGPPINRLGRDFDFRSSGTLGQRTRCQNRVQTMAMVMTNKPPRLAPLPSVVAEWSSSVLRTTIFGFRFQQC